MMKKPRKPQKEITGGYDKPNRDMFQTPNYATRLLLPFIPKEFKTIWEPACGYGKISNLLESEGYFVYASDIMYGEEFDFFKTNVPPGTDCIITNPPYSKKIKFYERCLGINKPFALLLQADYNQWLIDSIWYHGCSKIIPYRRVDYVTPTGKTGVGDKKSKSSAYWHSMWLVRGFGLDKTEYFVDLTRQQKLEDI